MGSDTNCYSEIKIDDNVDVPNHVLDEVVNAFKQHATNSDYLLAID